MKALHFIGFKGDEFTRAKQVFGVPDFIHRHNDKRSTEDFSEGDTVVFANLEEGKERIFSFDDSQHF